MDKKGERIETFKIGEVIILIIVTAIVFFASGIFLTLRIDKNNTKLYKENSYVSEIQETYEYIKNNYYGELDEKKMVENAVSGMLESVDDKNTEFLDENDSNIFSTFVNGLYDGIGIEIVEYDNRILILDVFENTPAFNAGLKTGDYIIKIDDILTEEIDIKELVNHIKSKVGKEISIVYERNGEKNSTTMVPGEIELDSVYSKIINNNSKKIGYIYISVFAKNTDIQFEKQLAELEKGQIDSLIIDVRENSGGYLDVATNIISLFLDSKNVIYKTEDKNGIKDHYSNGTLTKTYPIIVLTNNKSASAAEVLASSLKERYNAKLVGEKTYGKGTVQELITTSTGMQYKITTQYWLTPNGEWINGKGVEVDYNVKLDEKYYDEPSEKNDNQLQYAIELLK